MQIIQAERHRGNNIILNLYFLVAIFFPHFIALAWKIIKKFLPSFFFFFTNVRPIQGSGATQGRELLKEVVVWAVRGAIYKDMWERKQLVLDWNMLRL